MEDDLSPESGSDAMEVDDTPSGGSGQGNTVNISGVLLPDTMSKFHVRCFLEKCPVVCIRV